MTWLSVLFFTAPIYAFFLPEFNRGLKFFVIQFIFFYFISSEYVATSAFCAKFCVIAPSLLIY